eukprot:591637-Amphidinium_carterae.1
MPYNGHVPRGFVPSGLNPNDSAFDLLVAALFAFSEEDMPVPAAAGLQQLLKVMVVAIKKNKELEESLEVMPLARPRTP